MTKAKRPQHSPRRRPKQGGYARGDETRAQIVQVALHVFGNLGFDQAATREIAAQAGVTPPSLQYYFDGKEGLHRACAQHIIDRARSRMQPAFDKAAAALAPGGQPGALQALESLLDCLTDSLTEPGAELWSRFIHRGKQDGAGPGLDLIREQLSVPVFDAVSGLVGLLTALPATHELTRVRAMLVLGQIHWTHARRDEALRVLGWKELTPARLELIKAMVREHTRRALRDAPVLAGHAREN